MKAVGVQRRTGMAGVPGLASRVPPRRVSAKAGTNGAVKGADKPAPKPAAPSGPFTNTNRFKVDAAAVPAFEAEWRAREGAMRAFPGFQGFELQREGEDRFTASSTWATIPEWEAWSLSEPCRRSHLPLGVWQYVPAKGEGFPEDFVFFIDFKDPVNAKY